MAAGAIVVYNKAKINLVSSTNLFGGSGTWRLALFSSSYTPNAGDAGNEYLTDTSNQIANGNGYTTGGIALANVALSLSSGVVKFTCDPAVWTASGAGIPAWRYGVIYFNGTKNSKVDPLIGYFLGDSTPADVPLTTAGNTLTVTPNAAGLITLT